MEKSLEDARQAPPAGEERVDRYPPGVPYIVGNEAAERFSFYGMRAILVVHMIALYTGFMKASEVAPEAMADAKVKATQVFHLFTAAAYASPMIGALLADRLLGKYKVILWISLLYCVGHGVLAGADQYEWGMFIGLGFIALGAGGIKPCVSANVGDQFTRANAHLIPSIYQIFYFSINFGSFFATMMIPWLYERYGPRIAFGVPGVLMGIATFIFWLGRNRFVKMPPKPGGTLGFLDFLAGSLLFMAFAVFLFKKDAHDHDEAQAADASWWPLIIKVGIAVACLVAWFFIFNLRQSKQADSGFLSLLLYSIRHQRDRKPGEGFFDVARERFGQEAAEGPPAVLKIMLVFSMVSVFWALFDQHSSTWILQAQTMDLRLDLGFHEFHLTAAQIPSLNPLFVMGLIPILTFLVYKPLERRGLPLRPLPRMTIGLISAALSFVAVAAIEHWIAAAAETGEKVHVLWQVIPYILITVGEVMVSITGLEFAYTQAPRAMKSTIMGFWFLTVTLGNLLVAVLAPLQKTLSLAAFFWTFAGLMAAAAAVFAAMAYFYKGKTYLQDSGTA